jgi:hypothetical protein
MQPLILALGLAVSHVESRYLGNIPYSFRLLRKIVYYTEELDRFDFRTSVRINYCLEPRPFACVFQWV